jgi:hypothetical protein
MKTADWRIKDRDYKNLGKHIWQCVGCEKRCMVVLQLPPLGCPENIGVKYEKGKIQSGASEL